MAAALVSTTPEEHLRAVLKPRETRPVTTMHKVVFPEARDSSRSFPPTEQRHVRLLFWQDWRLFCEYHFVFIRVDSVFKESPTASLVVRLGGRGVATGLVALPKHFALEEIMTGLCRRACRSHKHLCRAMDAFCCA